MKVGSNAAIFSHWRLPPQIIHWFTILKQRLSHIIPEVCESLMDGMNNYHKSKYVHSSRNLI
jgi:hypothetical protein